MLHSQSFWKSPSAFCFASRYFLCVCMHMYLNKNTMYRTRTYSLILVSAVFYWKCIIYRSQEARDYDCELVLIHRIIILTENCFESECHLSYFPENVLFPTASKYCIFKLLGLESCKQWNFYSHSRFAALNVMSVVFNDTLLAWQDIQKCCQSVKVTDCSGISYRQITSSPQRVSYKCLSLIFWVCLS